MKVNLKLHKTKIFLIIIGIFILLAACGWLLLHHQKLIHNEAFFTEIDQDYTAFDSALKIQYGRTISYDQSAQCYYWKDSHQIFEISPGPLGCFKNRAYYISAKDHNTAYEDASSIASLLDKTFDNVQMPSSSTIMHHGGDYSGVYLAGNTPTGSSIPGACNFSIWYPASTPYQELPDRHDNSSLQVIISCGGDAAKAYYHFTGD